MNKDTPHVAIGNNELGRHVTKGDLIKCRCGKKHKLQYGTVNGKESNTLGFISCGKDSYLVSINDQVIARFSLDPRDKEFGGGK